MVDELFDSHYQDFGEYPWGQPYTKSCPRIYQELREDKYLIRNTRTWGVQIYVVPIIIVNLGEVALDYVVILLPRGAL